MPLIGLLKIRMVQKNPHDELDDPIKSAEVLQAHVDEGLKFARKK